MEFYNASRPQGLLATLLFASAAVLCSPPVAAQASACLNDDDRKVCLNLSAAPGDTLQPSNVPGAGDTYVAYSAVLTNIDTKSSRWVLVNFTLTSTATVYSLTADQGGSCQYSANTASCLFDKHVVDGLAEIGLVARLPDYSTTGMPSHMVNAVSFGWEGRSSQVISSVPIALEGYSFIPPNTRVTLVTGEERTDPSEQTSAENPLWAKMVIPPANEPRLARLRLVGDGPDISNDCENGVYLQPSGDGGPYVCRDNDNPRRWVEAALAGSYETDPIKLSMIWDDSIVPDIQLAPTPAAPTGTPRFAMFYNSGGEHSSNRAFADSCNNGLPPCLSNVTAYGNGDWAATLNKSTLEDPGQASSASSQAESGLVQEVLMADGGVGIQGFIPAEPPVGNIR